MDTLGALQFVHRQAAGQFKNQLIRVEGYALAGFQPPAKGAGALPEAGDKVALL